MGEQSYDGLFLKQGFVSPLPEHMTEFAGALFEEVATPQEEGRFSIADPRDIERMKANDMEQDGNMKMEGSCNHETL